VAFVMSPSRQLPRELCPGDPRDDDRPPAPEEPAYLCGAVEKTTEPVGPPVVTGALGEPELWPARRATFFDTDERLFVFGDIADSGHVALRFRGEEEHPDVVWLSDGESTPIAPSLGAYLGAWADAAFCIRGVLRRAGVRGWCG
jgi:hypothetical protein